MKIYTQKGDHGKTSLFGGTRVSKTHPQITAYGQLDELNSWIGYLEAQLASSVTSPNSPAPLDSDIKAELQNELWWIQDHLFRAGSFLATEDPTKTKHLPIPFADFTEKLEHSIDKMTHQLPALSSFVLPGGSLISSTAHICRTSCRKFERLLIELIENLEVKNTSDSPQTLVKTYKTFIKDFNRLSDYFFTFARFTQIKTNTTERLWKPQ